MRRIIAVIGTAGRARSPLLTRRMWEAMRRDFAKRVQYEDMLISGGAAWADHLAVDAYNNGLVADLELYLPAPLNASEEHPRFLGYAKGSGSATNYYHERFSRAIGVHNSIEDIAQAYERGAQLFCEPIGYGYRAMFRRNSKVAKRCNGMLAYTLGTGDEPDDGGTLDTWRQAENIEKRHICMLELLHDF